MRVKTGTILIRLTVKGLFALGLLGTVWIGGEFLVQRKQAANQTVDATLTPIAYEADDTCEGWNRHIDEVQGRIEVARFDSADRLRPPFLSDIIDVQEGGRLAGVRESGSLFVPARGGEPPYSQHSYVLRDESWVGHEFKLHGPCLAKAFARIRPTALALLARCGPQGLSAAIKVELWSGSIAYTTMLDGRQAEEDRIDRRWRWIAVDLTRFGWAEDARPADKLVITYGSEFATQREGRLHLASLAFVRRADWRPDLPSEFQSLPAPSDAAATAPLSPSPVSSAPTPPAEAVTQEGLRWSAPQPAIREAFLFDFRGQPEQAGGTAAFGSWQLDEGRAAKTDLELRPGYAWLSYELGPGASAAGHYFKPAAATVGRCLDQAGFRPSHVRLRLRSDSPPPQFTVELKAQRTYSFPVAVGSADRALVASGADLLLPLSVLAADDAVRNLTEFVLVFDPLEVQGHPTGHLCLEHLALVEF